MVACAKCVSTPAATLNCCITNDTLLRNCLTKWALIAEWGIRVGNKLSHLLDNMQRAGISDKDFIRQPAMEVFMMVIEMYSPHKNDTLICVCVVL